VEVQFAVSLTDLKRAFRRLILRLGDELLAADRCVFFDVSKNALEINITNGALIPASRPKKQ